MIPPLGLPMAYDALWLRVQRLERDLSLSLDLIQLLLARLDAKLGGDVLGDKLGKLKESDETAAREAVLRIDTLLRDGQQPAAVRFFREISGVTWDEAHSSMGAWAQFSVEQRTQWLKREMWMKTLKATLSSLQPRVEST